MNNDVRFLSFNSPKGGVGRTLTLINCAKIYSEGIEWAGLVPARTIMADFDFHAPGIHFYDFSKIFSTSQKEKIAYSIDQNINLDFGKLLLELDKGEYGILFLLSLIIQDESLKLKANEVSLVLNKINDDKKKIVLNEFIQYIDFLLVSDKTDPTKHLVRVTRDGKDNLFYLPAGSPGNLKFSELVFKFDWLDFINSYLGYIIIERIFKRIVSYLEVQYGVCPKTRILLDQQAGASVASALNKSIADTSIFVSGLNEQNKKGLISSLDNYFNVYKSKAPWIVLNQYKFRYTAFEYKAKESIGDIYSANFLNPHDKFVKSDKIRSEYIKELLDKKYPDFENRIFVTEFNKEAVQNEHFYNNDEVSLIELVKLLVNIEKRDFSNDNSFPLKIEVIPERIIILGERVLFKGHYAGPLFAFYKYLRGVTNNKTKIIALASTHEEIVTFAKQKKIKGVIKDNRNRDNKLSLKDDLLIETGIYDLVIDENGCDSICLNELDYICYPYYALSYLTESSAILSFAQDQFHKSIDVEDSLTGTSLEYYRTNIVKWKEYSEYKKRIVGVPLFVNFQLLAYPEDCFKKEANFLESFRNKFHRNFDGFNYPQDLMDFAEFRERKNRSRYNPYLLLSGNPTDVSMWYEWQTIAGMFYKRLGTFEEITTISKFVDFILSDESLDGLLMYLQLFKISEHTKVKSNEMHMNDWDRLLSKFYSDDNENTLVLIWPDAIPRDYRKGEKQKQIYQIPPSFHIFEECWLVSVIQKDEAHEYIEGKVRILNNYLTPHVQREILRDGGLPTHKSVLGDLDMWVDYAFIPPIWLAYTNGKLLESTIERKSIKNIEEVGKVISSALKGLHTTKKITKNILRETLLVKLKEYLKK